MIDKSFINPPSSLLFYFFSLFKIKEKLYIWILNFFKFSSFSPNESCLSHKQKVNSYLFIIFFIFEI